MKQNSQNGFIALSSVIVIMVVVLLTGTAVSLLSVDDIQLALSHKNSEASLAFVEGCVEDALLTLNTDNSLPTTVTLPEGSCSITSVSQNGNSWSFVVSGTFNNFAKSVQVVVDRASGVSINDWTEI